MKEPSSRRVFQVLRPEVHDLNAPLKGKMANLCQEISQLMIQLNPAAPKNLNQALLLEKLCRNPDTLQVYSPSYKLASMIWSSRTISSSFAVRISSSFRKKVLRSTGTPRLKGVQ